MTARVSFLRPRDVLTQAESAYCSAEYSRALELVGKIAPPTSASQALQANILRRLGRMNEAIDAARSGVLIAASDEEVGFAQVALANIYVSLGDPDRAGDALAAIKGKRGSLSVALRSEIATTRAYLAYCADDLARTEEEIIEAYIDDRPFSRARATMLQSFVFGARGDYRSQSEILTRSLRELREVPLGTYDIGVRAQILYSLAGLARDIVVPIAAEELREELRAIPWTPYLNEARYWACRSVGFRMAQDGGMGARIGIDLLRRSTDYASTPARRVLSALDASSIAFAVNEPQSGGAFLDEAERISEEVDWNKEIREERLALLQAATLFARQGHIERSRKYLTIFRDLPPMAPMMALAHDRRLEAERAYAEGVLSRVCGERQHAEKTLVAAYEICASTGYVWQAALCAQELHEITEDEYWRDSAREHVRAYPHSWLASKVKRIGLDADSRYTALTPTERRVFDLLVNGVARAEIAQRLGSKQSTTNKHVEHVFAKWNVHSQLELLAEVQRVR